MTEMQRLTYNKERLILVKAPFASHCTGCLYINHRDVECPRKSLREKICLYGGEEDLIFIEDTPEALAEYISRTLTGDWK